MSNLWIRIKTDTGREYFHNHKLDKTVWTLPKGHTCKDDKKTISIEQGVAQGIKRESLEHPDGQPPSTTKQPVQQKKSKQPPRNSKRTANKRGGTKTTKPTKPTKPTKNTAAPSKNNASHMDDLSMTHNPSLSPTSSNSSTHNPSIRRGSGASTGSKSRTHICAHVDPRNVSASVWLMWLTPVLICVAINLYYFQVVEKWGDRQRVSQWNQEWGNVTERSTYKGQVYDKSNYHEFMQIIQLNSGHQTALVYKKYGFEYKRTSELRAQASTAATTCRNDFANQAGEAQQELCEAYCSGCVLGGDTGIYPYMPLYVAALWSIVVLLSAIFLPIIRICLKINKLKATGGQKKDALKDNKNAKFGGYTTRDARVYLLLLLSFLIFAVTLFLIHFGRVIDVPQGHSMFTYWMFFSCYFFGTSMLYWSRMDIAPIKPRQPELSLGVAFLGYTIVTHVVGAYYLTGIQAWPCLISMMIAYIVNPAYFLSFIRRGLELWSVHNHHRSILKKMKKEEMSLLMANASEEGEDNYDPEEVALVTAAKLKLKKARKKEIKKQKKAQKKAMKQKQKQGDIESGGVELPTVNNKHLGGSSTQIRKDVKKQRRKNKLSTDFLQKEMEAGLQNIDLEGDDVCGADGRLLHHPDSSVGDGPVGQKKNKNKKKNKCPKITIRRIYWSIVLAGTIFCALVYRFVKLIGEVGCMAREGTVQYLFLGIAATVMMLVTLFMLRKIADEHSIRRELNFVAVIASAFMMPHVIMLLYANKTMTNGLGCTHYDSLARVGLEAYNDSTEHQACLVMVYANWLILIMVTLIHTASITFPLMLSLQMGADKLRETSMLSTFNFNGPQLLSSFETAVNDPLCARYFRRFLANEFTLDNMRFLVEIETFKTTLKPSSAGILIAHESNVTKVEAEDVEATNNDSKGLLFARACHTVNAWQTFSGNLPITLVSIGGRKKIGLKASEKDTIDLDLMIIQARNIVRKYFSNSYWCKLFDKSEINNSFRNLYRSLMRIQTEMTLHENQNDIDEETVIRIQKSHGQQKADRMASQNEEKKLKQFIAQREKIFHVFDKVQTMLYTSLVTKSYPAFISSDIGLELRRQLDLKAASDRTIE